MGIKDDFTPETMNESLGIILKYMESKKMGGASALMLLVFHLYALSIINTDDKADAKELFLKSVNEEAWDFMAKRATIHVARFKREDVMSDDGRDMMERLIKDITNSRDSNTEK